MSRILYVHSRKASFVAIDREILASRHEVEDLYQPGRVPPLPKVVRGVLRADVRMQCSRCLDDLEVEVAADVAELFTNETRIVEPAAEVEEGYEIRDAAIDLDTLVRDALVPAVPYQALCEAACRGLCPTCGVNLNEVADDHGHEPVGDPRWAALESLRLPPDD